MILFRIGAWSMMLAAGGHFIAGLVDAIRPTVFVPVDPAAQAAMRSTHMALTARTDMWSAWLGFNIGFGLGIAAFAYLVDVIARRQPALMRERAVLVAVLLVTAVLFATSIRYWFFAPSTALGVSLVCFALGAQKRPASSAPSRKPL